MNGGEKGLQALSLIAIVILSIVAIDLLNEPEQDPEIVYVLIDNRITIDENFTAEELDRSEVARVATFNIKVFGDTKMSNVTVVAELVELFQDYDMVAVQEIKDIDEEVPYLFLNELNGIAGQENLTNQSREWEMVLSERSGMQDDDKNSQEQYAFYYKPTVFTSMDNGTLYDDSTNDSFQREPFLATFMLLDTNGEETGTDIVFVNIHTKPTLAVEELGALGDVLSWAQTNYSDDDDYVILGDFNGDCSYASYNELVDLSISSENYTWLIPDDADTTVGNSRCAYDRIVTSSQLDERLTGQWGIDETVSSGAVSDHKPVWFDIKRI
ncbi:endonuclease/exonuclease/phosphatase family protein [Candidatus Poseidonia alphae]|nr:endonuclease/exonuclease/phosphatase family protein [Candidatus Poseidonia alphae]MDA8639027.1 endonuclease/exonuclease/phosphatase family protein [Candidatus Poseidonia alphae]MDA8749557.1 endonuclease/exonuclease/phosphatase family protein [Candidatus Poseidonia alphae]MDA8759193.1 endonuclease/exonuclease/phosphatase family protein [Candidatus Poseidonia alphae]MDA8839356.1 endonuclease/exonuclease/phosphatase family protein [Candidatus Poseidonia alphae]